MWGVCFICPPSLFFSCYMFRTGSRARTCNLRFWRPLLLLLSYARSSPPVMCACSAGIAPGGVCLPAAGRRFSPQAVTSTVSAGVTSWAAGSRTRALHSGASPAPRSCGDHPLRGNKKTPGHDTLSQVKVVTRSMQTASAGLWFAISEQAFPIVYPVSNSPPSD